MNATVTLDEAGRVVIPEGLRDELHLNVGDALTLETEGDRIILRRANTAGLMRKEHGVWVFRAGVSLPADLAAETLDHVRQERDVSNNGGKT